VFVVKAEHSRYSETMKALVEEFRGDAFLVKTEDQATRFQGVDAAKCLANTARRIYPLWKFEVVEI
jgi:hypothetical protein